ncbi:MAG: ribonuclease E inhibitor RraB [Anaerolineales bacterium]|nr:ribonuclease E inhibitor RraB [Anaerolineales bacterium]
MANDLPYQLKTNEMLWHRWLDFGITSGAEFEVEFHFYTSKEQAADELIAGLEKAGLSAKKSINRTLFILKGWTITVPISQSWTLEILNEQTRRFCKLADMLHLTFDGCGAYMPWKGQEPPKHKS